jgi:tetratricopeptide (TPR) repeat protein
MRQVVRSLAILASALATAGTLQAGVYNLDPPRKYPSDFVETNVAQPLWQVRDYLIDLRGVQDNRQIQSKPPAEGSLRKSYEEQFAALEAKRREGTFDVRDRINLSACLIRFGRSAEARERLEESLRFVPPDHPYRFLLLLHLAAVNAADENLLQRAIDVQREALDAWPKHLAIWNRWESAWYRHAEQYVLTLMELRNREQIAAQGRPARDLQPLDRLFPKDERDPAKKVQFVGANGDYEAGAIAPRQMDRLPSDAYEVVLQLVLWNPSDFRLVWLYGELLNARGQVDWAFDTLDRIVQERLRNRELDRHWRVLRDAVTPYKELFTDSTGSGENLRKQALLLWSLAPHGTSGLLTESGGLATATLAALPPVETPLPAPPAAVAAGGLPDWRLLTIGFLTGFVVAVLGILQWQQWRRPRRVVSGASTRYAADGEMAGPSSYSHPTDG